MRFSEGSFSQLNISPGSMKTDIVNKKILTCFMFQLWILSQIKVNLMIITKNQTMFYILNNRTSKKNLKLKTPDVKLIKQPQT